MPKYYLLDENKNLVEGFDKEGFLALLEQAIEQGSLENIDPDSAVASKIRSVLNGTTHHIEFVTQAQFNQLVADEQLVKNTYYFITDDTTLEGLENSIGNLDGRLTDQENSMNGLLNGELHAQYAYVAETIRNGLYLHDIYMNYRSNLSYTFRIAFRLLTKGNHATISNTYGAIKSVINELYGDKNKLPASGSYVHYETVAGQSYKKMSVVNSIAYYSDTDDLRAICHILGEINDREGEGFSLSGANEIEVITIKLI